jgi:hypothetical protein
MAKASLDGSYFNQTPLRIAIDSLQPQVIVEEDS